MEAFEFWSKIKQKLSELGKTQEWLCNKTGIDLQAMRNRIYKERFPSIQDTLKILSVFDVSAEEFFGMSPEAVRSNVSKDVMLIPDLQQE